MKTRLAAVALALVVAAGCGRNDKAEKLAALESAYRSGVFTREEYEAKKAALIGPSAAAPPPVAVAKSAPAPASADSPPAPPPQPAAPVDAQPPAVSRRPAQSAAPPPQPAAPVDAQPPAVSRRPAQSAALPPQPAAPVTAAPLVVPTRPAQPAAALPPADAAPPPAATAPAHPARPPAAADEPAAPGAGCEDADNKAGKEKGLQERFYPAPVGAVKRAAEAALKNLDFTIHKDAASEIEASKRRHLGALVGAGGERVLLHFERSQRGAQTGTLVTGETRKSLVGRMAQKSWTNAVLAQIACQLKAR